jgi:DNA mismatch endonuclease, patch repair protein
MTDTLTRRERSELMARIRSKNTGFESAFRSLLRQAGVRSRVANHLPGKPDLVFPGARAVVFLDSCFWHGCRWHCRMPKSNRRYWLAKIAGNRARDKAVMAQYRRSGWRAIRIWEHSITRDPWECVNRIVLLTSQRRERMGQPDAEPHHSQTPTRSALVSRNPNW